MRIIDTGIGIAPDRQGEVFHELVQLHNPERDRNKGLGLGLAIVRRLVDLLQVPLALRSVPGRGTAFTLRLLAAEPGGAGSAEGSADGHGRRRPPRRWCAGAGRGRRCRHPRRHDPAAEPAGACASSAPRAWPTCCPLLMGLQAKPCLLICDYRLRGRRGWPVGGQRPARPVQRRVAGDPGDGRHLGRAPAPGKRERARAAAQAGQPPGLASARWHRHWPRPPARARIRSFGRVPASAGALISPRGPALRAALDGLQPVHPRSGP